jgi:hypothetical protein
MNKLDVVRAVLSCCVILAGCGGGGGGGDSPNSGNPGTPGTTYSISLDRSRVDLLTEENGPSGLSEDVTVTFNGTGVVVGTLPGATLPDWIVVGSPTVISSTQVRIQLRFFPMNIVPNTPQRVSTTLRFVTGDATGTQTAMKDLTVTGTIDHTLSRSSELYTWTRGATALPASSVDVTTANATWEASSSAPWLTASPTSGSGNATLNLTTAPGTLAEGDYVATLSVRDTVTNRTKATTVRLGVDPRRLELDRRGLALSSTLGRSRVNATLRVIDTAGLAGRWTLSDDAAWLTASAANGTGSTDITLEAHDSGLTNGTHYANVTVSPDNETGFANSATLRVGFFVDKTTPITSPTRIPGEEAFVWASDPVRPLIYGLRNDQPNGVTLRAWNVHTGALVHSMTIPNVSFPARGRVAPDGSQLVFYASGESQLIPVALSAGTPVVGAPWTGMRRDSDDFVFTRINGADVIVWSAGQLLSAANGNVVANAEGLSQALATFPSSIAVSPNGQRLFMSGKTLANHFLAYGALGYRAGNYSARVLSEFLEANNGEAVYFDPDGEHVVSRSSNDLTRYTFPRTTADNSVPKGGYDLSPSAFSGFYLTEITGANWLHYSGDLTLLASMPTPPGDSYLFAISGDETRIFIRDTSQSGFFGSLRDLGL